MSKFRKIRNNLLSGRAISVLGLKQYTRYLANFFANIARILRDGDLRSLDKAMGLTAKQFHYRGSSFFFDCQFCDEHLNENSFAFGLVREIYIRDCYFRWLPSSVYDRARTVIDLGANRGAFSSLMTTKARFILIVECQEQYVPVIHHNMLMNSFMSYAIETAFVGAGGSVTDSNSPRLTVDELFERHKIEFVDLIKLDIEGSEFALFDSSDWLQRVNAVSMEVHSLHGNPNDILESITQHGFSYAIADEDLQRVKDTKHAKFIYAWKNA
ncbi:MAG: FkbM family methyltransferase [Bacteroidota bacterium]|nr:FkbM family methyltransferase [Bacteroidota bacterium]